MPEYNDDYKYYGEPEGERFPEEYDDYEGESSKTKLLKARYNALRTKLLSRKVQDQSEELDRLTNPAVQKAWEQYQIVLNLSKKS